jgi:hypothetical protein
MAEADEEACIIKKITLRTYGVKKVKGDYEMENIIESPVSQGMRQKIGMIEAVELPILGFILWGLASLLLIGSPDVDIMSIFSFFIMIEVGLLGSWGIYNLYIRIARAGGKRVDVGLWIIATAATASYTFWAWTILDINRWIMKKLFYRGEAPVEYAWSARSKQVRKMWEMTHKS